jgi:hypothetical protein
LAPREALLAFGAERRTPRASGGGDAEALERRGLFGGLDDDDARRTAEVGKDQRLKDFEGQ